jgi:hypothetical protein
MGKVSMSKDEAHELVIKCGMEIVNIYPIGAIPAHEKFMIIPSWVSSIIDWLVCNLGFGEILCQNVIYVCRKKSSDVNNGKNDYKKTKRFDYRLRV